jgi:hypothetical protein
MVHDLETHRLARALIDEHGEDAPAHAAAQASACQKFGDWPGVSKWKLVLATIDELQGRQRGPDVALE